MIVYVSPEKEFLQRGRSCGSGEPTQKLPGCHHELPVLLLSKINVNMSVTVGLMLGHMWLGYV